MFLRTVEWGPGRNTRPTCWALAGSSMLHSKLLGGSLASRYVRSSHLGLLSKALGHHFTSFATAPFTCGVRRSSPELGSFMVGRGSCDFPKEDPMIP